MKIILSTLLILLPFFILAQEYKIKIGESAEMDPTELPEEFLPRQEVKVIQIKTEGADDTSLVHGLECMDNPLSFKTNNEFHPLDFGSDIRGKTITLRDENGNIKFTFTIPKPGNRSPDSDKPTNTGSTIILPSLSATQYVSSLFPYPTLENKAKQGLKIKEGARHTKFSGDQYIHLFFDGNGNTLIRSIPVGIERANYVAHIIYLAPANALQSVDYKINQGPADVSESVLIRGEGDLDNLAIREQAGGQKQKIIEFKWQHFEIALEGLSKDIKLDIVRNLYQLQGDALVLPEPTIIATRIIRMKRIYHGSLEVGILDSRLANPTFTLTPSDIDPTQNVVKKTDDDHRVFASAMYTFYVSPIVLLEKLFMPGRVENFRLEGRNFVDDHRIYERIYPTFGIALNNRVLDNLFLGGKWEFVRGGSVFLGYHRGKVNTFETPPDFKFSETYITEETFNLRTTTKWTGAFCIGLNLDVRIISNLFQPQSQATP